MEGSTSHILPARGVEPVTLKYTKWQELAFGGVSVGACAIVVLALATEVPWFVVILVAASTFPTLVILGLVAIDVRTLMRTWWQAAAGQQPGRPVYLARRAQDGPGSAPSRSAKRKRARTRG